MQFASPRSDAHLIDLSTIASAKAETFRASIGDPMDVYDIIPADVPSEMNQN
jgi:hypothetical protein